MHVSLIIQGHEMLLQVAGYSIGISQLRRDELLSLHSWAPNQTKQKHSLNCHLSIFTPFPSALLYRRRRRHEGWRRASAILSVSVLLLQFHHPRR